MLEEGEEEPRVAALREAYLCGALSEAEFRQLAGLVEDDAATRPSAASVAEEELEMDGVELCGVEPSIQPLSLQAGAGARDWAGSELPVLGLVCTLGDSCEQSALRAPVMDASGRGQTAWESHPLQKTRAQADAMLEKLYSVEEQPSFEAVARPAHPPQGGPLSATRALRDSLQPSRARTLPDLRRCMLESAGVLIPAAVVPRDARCGWCRLW